MTITLIYPASCCCRVFPLPLGRLYIILLFALAFLREKYVYISETNKLTQLDRFGIQLNCGEYSSVFQ